MNQLKVELDEEELEVALAILHQLDHRGFFVGDEAKIAVEFGTSKEFVEDLREFIMTELEPVGIASKGYEEFFCVQLRELYPEEPNLCQKVSEEFLKTGAGNQRVKDIATRLRLTPFEGEQSPYKVGSVDVILERDQDGWLVLLMEDFIDFEVQEGEREEKERALRWKRLLDLRRNLLRGCINLMVERQEDFLLGVGPLKALELTEVAQKLGVSVSVISRLVSNKYVKTHTAGIYPLRFFFQRRAKGGYSREQVLRALKEILQKHGKLKRCQSGGAFKGKGHRTFP
jgi:RNA polymerase sigma-54 factor